MPVEPPVNVRGEVDMEVSMERQHWERAVEVELEAKGGERRRMEEKKKRNRWD